MSDEREDQELRALFARRPRPETAQLWPGVLARLTPQRRRPRWAWRAAVSLSAAAAAAAIALVAVYTRPLPPPPVAQAEDLLDPKALAALDKAEREYREAARVLEQEYAANRSALDPAMAQRWDAALARTRAQLGASRALAAEDVNARLRVLDGYAGYLRSLREASEASP